MHPFLNGDDGKSYIYIYACSTLFYPKIRTVQNPSEPGDGPRARIPCSTARADIYKPSPNATPFVSKENNRLMGGRIWGARINHQSRRYTYIHPPNTAPQVS